MGSIYGIHSPGDNGPGIQTFSSTNNFNVALDYNGTNSRIVWELTANTANGPGTNFDQVLLTVGDLQFAQWPSTTNFSPVFNAAGSTVDWSDPFWSSNHSWLVYDLTTGTTSNLNQVLLGGSLIDSLGNTLNPTTRGSFSLGLSGQDVVLNFVAVPEPATCGLGVIGLGLAAGVSRLRRRSRARSLANRPAGRGPSGTPEGPPPAAKTAGRRALSGI
jgi:hypothetical protein